jgi:hypothetical protein
LLPWAVLIVALGLRLFRLDFESFWFDEVASLAEADLPLAEVLARYYWPPLFSIVLKPLAGSVASEALLRLPAALFGAATVFLFHRAVIRETPAWIATGCALLFATSAFHVELSQQVRHYTLGILALWLCHGAFRGLLARRDDSWRPGLLWAGSAVLAYLSIFLALPLLVVQGVYGLAKLRGPRRVRFLLLGAGVTAALSPWLLGSLQQADRVPNQLRYAGGHLEGLTDALAKTFLGYLPLPDWLRVAGLLALLAIVVVGMLRERVHFPAVPFFSFFGLLFGLAVLTAFVSDPYPRYFTLTLPFFFALLARSLTNFPPRVAGGILALLLAVSVVEVGYQLRERQHPDWRGVASRLAEPDFPVCTIVFGMPNMERTLLWYLERDHPGIEVRVHALEGGYTMDAAGARKIEREFDALAAERDCVVYVQGFEWFSDPERMALQYLVYRYPSIEVSSFPAAAAFRLTEAEDR